MSSRVSSWTCRNSEANFRKLTWEINNVIESSFEINWWLAESHGSARLGVLFTGV